MDQPLLQKHDYIVKKHYLPSATELKCVMIFYFSILCLFLIYPNSRTWYSLRGAVNDSSLLIFHKEPGLTDPNKMICNGPYCSAEPETIICRRQEELNEYEQDIWLCEALLKFGYHISPMKLICKVDIDLAPYDGCILNYEMTEKDKDHLLHILLICSALILAMTMWGCYP